MTAELKPILTATPSMSVGLTHQPINLAGGMQLSVGHHLDHAVGADTVVVPAWLNRSRTYDPALLEVLRETSERGSRIVSMCTGAFVLAAAGLLDGRPATTHWLHASLLQEWYPSIDVKADLLYVDDGDILSSAGSSAAIDLSLHLVAKDHGSAVAADVARRLVLAPHTARGSNSVFNQGPFHLSVKVIRSGWPCSGQWITCRRLFASTI